jgi:hypothetical protein
VRFTQSDIEELLEAWPRLRRRPNLHGDVCSLAGPLAFSMSPPGLPTLENCYSIRIDVPLRTTEVAPAVYEEGSRIPRDVHHHVYDSGALCLGSPWTVRQKLGEPASLIKLVEQCIVPFLYAATWREQGGTGYPFADLAHGGAGLLEDYESILGLTGSQAVAGTLQALTHRPREANKLACPCGCQRRLGCCPYRMVLASLRDGMTRSFFRGLLMQFAEAYPPSKRAPPNHISPTLLEADR